MPFENAHISKAEYEAYQLAEIDKRYIPMSYCSEQWTIDRGRNIHLRCVSRSVPPDMGPHDPFWLFFWKSSYVVFGVHISEHATKRNGWVAQKSLTRLELPEELVAFREEIVSDIKDALQTYGTGGVHCIAENFQLRLEISA